MYCNPSAPTGVQAPGFPMIAAPSLFVQHPRPSRVSFQDTRMEVRVVSLACLSDELRRDIWYTPSDIETMRTEARDLCRYLRVNPQACPEEHTRGLELRISLERQCRKQLTVQGVVEAQRRSTDPAFLACLAQRCSMVPKEMALAQAQRDYCNVYNINAPTTTQSAAAAAAPTPAAPSTSDISFSGNKQTPIRFPQSRHCSSSSNNNSNNTPLFASSSHQRVQTSTSSSSSDSVAMELQQPGLLQDEFDCCLEPIPLSAPDQSMMVLQGNKRMLSMFAVDNPHHHHHQDRMVRQRLEGYPAA